MSEQVAVAARLAAVRERIARACERVGRPAASVQLLAVSKRHSVSAMREAYAAGQREFGENYVQELVQKAEQLADLPDLRLHFIGHLQRNKVKDIVRVRALVDTVDSLRLGEALASRAAEEGLTLPVFVQVNVAGEAQKSGVSLAELPALLASLARLPSLRVRGLLTIPPAVEDPEQSRQHFRSLRELARAHGLTELSMGMSDDLEVAIEEGATTVRVGTAIFGPRA